MCCILPYKVRIHLNLSPCQPPRSQLHGNRLLPQQKNQPTNHLPQLPRPRPPDYDRSIGEEIEEESEVRKTMTDERDVVVILRVSSINLLFSLFSSLSLVSCCPQLSPKTIMSFHDKFLVWLIDYWPIPLDQLIDSIDWPILLRDATQSQPGEWS